jgi:hypothetical protein
MFPQGKKDLPEIQVVLQLVISGFLFPATKELAGKENK